MDNYIVFGGSQGLGKEIAENLNSSNTRRAIRCQRKGSESRLGYENWDMGKMKKEEYVNLFDKYWPLKGLCFAQRYRGKTDCIEEYKVMVEGTANALEAFIRILESKPSLDLKPAIVVVGSTYAERVGFDQGWSYHASKSSQLALVRYYAMHNKGLFTINMVSPSTYKKEGSEIYWKNSDKEKHWNNLAPGRLANVREIAKEITTILTSEGLFMSGNNIYLDAGINNLYHDQQ